MIPTKTNREAVPYQGDVNDHFNLWDWWDGRAASELDSDSNAVIPDQPNRPVSGLSNVIPANNSTVAWTAESVLAKCESLVWPEWVRGFRPGQLQATAEILNSYGRGIRTVLLDAPTGTGKTLIGEMVRRVQGVNGLYVCSGLELQDQFAGDFEYGRVLKGRGNYSTVNMPFPEYTAADCTAEPGKSGSCTYCPNANACGYTVAKQHAVMAQLAVLNTTYFLYEANHAHKFSGKPFIVVDECDMVESELMRFVEFRITERMMNECGVVGVKKGAHRPTIKTWMENELIPGLKSRGKQLKSSNDPKVRKSGENLLALAGQAAGVAETVEDENWIRDYETDRRGNELESFVMRPVTVGKQGGTALFSHGIKWLLMSATIVSGKQMVEDIGIPGGQGEVGGWEVVTVPMEFPVEHRPIVVRGVANVTRKTEVEERPKLAAGIAAVLDLHGSDNILVHTHSYQLTRWLINELKRHPQAKRFLSYDSARERGRTLAEFKRRGGVLFGPSLDRGVDLSGDSCRVMVIAKTPFANLGDKQVSTRIRLSGGNTWYSVQTIRTIIQMTGRGVRNKDDWAVTYILDKQFVDKVWKDNKSLFPSWWRDGVKEGGRAEWMEGLRRALT